MGFQLGRMSKLSKENNLPDLCAWKSRNLRGLTSGTMGLLTRNKTSSSLGDSTGASEMIKQYRNVSVYQFWTILLQPFGKWVWQKLLLLKPPKLSQGNLVSSKFGHVDYRDRAKSRWMKRSKLKLTAYKTDYFQFFQLLDSSNIWGKQYINEIKRLWQIIQYSLVNKFVQSVVKISPHVWVQVDSTNALWGGWCIDIVR